MFSISAPLPNPERLHAGLSYDYVVLVIVRRMVCKHAIRLKLPSSLFYLLYHSPMVF